jgi:flagellin-like protein
LGWDVVIQKIRSKQAVSEVIGVVLLLGMTVTLYAVLNSNISSFSFSPSAPFANLIGTIDKTNKLIYIEHNGGESLELTTNVRITIGSNSYQKKANDLLIDMNHDYKWDFGETLQFNFNGIDISGKYIQVTVMDSNAILLSAVLQQGLS